MSDNAAPPSWVVAARPRPNHRFRLADLLAESADPPSVIVGAARSLGDGETLRLEAPFDPQPLRRLLAGQGMDTYSACQPDGSWYLYCRPCEPTAAAPASGDEKSHSRFWLSDGRMHLDVRDLPPPQPMIEILRVLESGLADHELVAHVPHMPVHLLPEVEERGWSWQILSDQPEGTQILLTLGDAP